MGELMHQLHADQQRLEERAEAIPGMQVVELAAMRTAAEYRLMQTIGEQRAELERLREEVAVLTGKKAPPKPHGFKGFMFEVQAEDSVVWCLAERDEPDEDERFSTRRYVPQCPQTFAVFLNGSWVSASELCNDGALTVDSLDSAAEDHCRAEWEAAVDRIAEERSYLRALGV